MSDGKMIMPRRFEDPDPETNSPPISPQYSPPPSQEKQLKINTKKTVSDKTNLFWIGVAIVASIVLIFICYAIYKYIFDKKEKPNEEEEKKKQQEEEEKKRKIKEAKENRQKIEEEKKKKNQKTTKEAPVKKVDNPPAEPPVSLPAEPKNVPQSVPQSDSHLEPIAESGLESFVDNTRGSEYLASEDPSNPYLMTNPALHKPDSSDEETLENPPIKINLTEKETVDNSDNESDSSAENIDE